MSGRGLGQLSLPQFSLRSSVSPPFPTGTCPLEGCRVAGSPCPFGGTSQALLVTLWGKSSKVPHRTHPQEGSDPHAKSIVTQSEPSPAKRARAASCVGTLASEGFLRLKGGLSPCPGGQPQQPRWVRWITSTSLCRQVSGCALPSCLEHQQKLQATHTPFRRDGAIALQPKGAGVELLVLQPRCSSGRLFPTCLPGIWTALGEENQQTLRGHFWSQEVPCGPACSSANAAALPAGRSILPQGCQSPFSEDSTGFMASISIIGLRPAHTRIDGGLAN